MTTENIEDYNNRKIFCGGLEWNIYIHPNQGQYRDGYALSVFPLKVHNEDTLPSGYKLKCSIKASVQVSMDQKDDNDDEKYSMRNRDNMEMTQFDTIWEEKYSQNDLMSDVNMNDISSGGWQPNIHRLQFTMSDLNNSNVEDENGCFTLCISIHSSFEREEDVKSSNNGVIGAVLVCYTYYIDI